ncbi:hypothetical protein QWY20_10410 [Alkalimonas sp. MEB108]|uniref:Uncharacterized protein n=1 Tax=Alkalimonas cellulosilytica TaxID=3058395 RepID=A0ABU7J6C4_9GAMM|nr:hypothetical protein [Alkalimonas sp. MEB108]MEE2001863.1 hypothetical protein [Alkalimonas sp. MEB108]
MFTAILQSTLSKIAHNKNQLIRALAIPMLLLILIEYFWELGYGTVFDIALHIGWFLMYSIIAILTHRSMLLGQGTASMMALPSWGKRETAYLLRLIGYALIIACAAILMLIPMLGGLLFVVALLILLGRFALVFPAIAVDYPISFRDSWHITSGHTLLMVLIVAILPVGLALPMLVIEYLPYGFLLLPIVSVAMTVLTIAALSETFRYLVPDFQHQPADDKYSFS